ncbi:MAG TPA: class I SAM-dependent methyltransferase [Candidatus Methylacidiphilales bacterium]|nr:class I SAM-dependent methyltransferase [Candidatus Methylacidiphilales bacterium]
MPKSLKSAPGAVPVVKSASKSVPAAAASSPPRVDQPPAAAVPILAEGEHAISDDAVKALSTAQTTVHRLFTSERGWIDRYGDRFLLSVWRKADVPALTQRVRVTASRLGLPCRAIFARLLEKNPGQDSTPFLVASTQRLDSATAAATFASTPEDADENGAKTPLHIAEEMGQLTVLENGVRFGIDIAAGYSPGLFLDQRENRRALQLNPPSRLLNLFAYTCSFSVVAAVAGCKETCSVDLSKKSLDRGRENFRLNGLDFTPSKSALTGVLKIAPRIPGPGLSVHMPGGIVPCPPSSRHRFIADDVFRILPYLRKRGETFDAIILDPPTFARGTKVGSFRVERDLPQLLEACMALAAPQCRLLVSINCSTMQLATLQNLISEAARSAGKRYRLAIPAPPVDFPGFALPTMLWVQLG